MKTLVIVDVQPEYQEAFTFNMDSFKQFVDDFSGNVLVMYNGEHTLDMISEDDLQNWYQGEEEIYNSLYHAAYHDKGYAFFRGCMDHGFADEVLIPFVRYMWENDVRDSRLVNWDEVDELMAASPDDWDQQLVEFLREEQECIFVPDLMDVLNDTPGDLYLVGGGVDQCLREVVIALDALEREYTVIDEYTY